MNANFIDDIIVLGTFLLAAGLVLSLLPFTIAGAAAEGWSEGYIIAMLVLGFVALGVFFLVERYVAKVPFLDWKILTSRTVLGTCLLSVTYQIAYYCWNGYYTSYLQVVYGVSITTAGYINSIFDAVSGVWLFIVGILIRKTGRFKWLLWIAVPLYLLGEGLMIYFRQPSMGVGYNIMCQIFLAFAGGAMIIVMQVAVTAAADHNNVAAVLAFLGVFGNIGRAIGSSISGAIWTHTLPDALQRLLPESVNADWAAIYEDLELQLSFEIGTPERDAISAAYAYAQERMLIAGTAIMVLALIWVAVIRDIKLTKEVQNKGVLF
jgi:MFS family permease